MAAASSNQLASGNWRVQVRRKNRYVSETFRQRKEGEDWALDMERNIDRSGSVARLRPVQRDKRDAAPGSPRSGPLRFDSKADLRPVALPFVPLRHL